MEIVRNSTAMTWKLDTETKTEIKMEGVKHLSEVQQ